MKNKLRNILQKKNGWMILLLVGILLVVIAMPVKKSSDNSISEAFGATEANNTDMEKRLEDLLSQMPGVGEVHVMITYQQDEVVEGIVVLAEGGKNAVVVRNITDVVQALFDVDSHNIKVIERNQNN